MNLPNKITMSRLVLSVVFFVLASYESKALLDIAETVFIVACVTDFFDGYFARKLNLHTAFGRIADPVVDKVIVCGGFVLMAGQRVNAWGGVSLIAPWMVVVIISREFLISSIRGYAESRGIAFGAEMTGKVKAVLQMFALGFALYFYAHGNLPWLPEGVSEVLVLVAIYAALAATVLSMVTYAMKAKKIFSAIEGEAGM